MSLDKAIHRLHEELLKLDTAIFRDYSTSYIKFPTTIIHLTRISSDGIVWFKLKKPYKELTSFDECFFCELNFYKKAAEYFIKLEGYGNIVRTENERAYDDDIEIREDEALIRFMTINYTVLPEAFQKAGLLLKFKLVFELFMNYYHENKWKQKLHYW